MARITLTHGRLADAALLAAAPPALLAALLPVCDGIAPLRDWTEVIYVVLLLASLGPYFIAGFEAQRYGGLVA